jgi:hypothetical protein
MNFEKNKYIVVKEVISKDMSSFLFNYFHIKRQVAKTCFEEHYISPFETIMGSFSDTQLKDTYSCYADIAFETLLLKLIPIMEEKTKLKLIPSYAYARLYKKGDELKRHMDRFSCEISTTLNLGGDKWPIYVDPTGGKGEKGIKVVLNPGDMLIYKGCELEHWREKFEGEECGQVFLHYNNVKTKGSEDNIYDTRPHLGLPASFKK